jgi:glyoxylase-like metal-dependent hydrolase (beta-lactamase superfamily II)
MELVDGIHRVDEASANMAHSNVYLLIEENELIVIDTGTAGNAKKIVDYVQKIGRQPSDISTIVLTHFHMDHSGSVRELKDLTNAKVAVHAEDADYVSGKKPIPKPKNALFRAVTSFIKLTPVQPDIILQDNDKIGKLTAIHMPGHTPGSIALLDQEKKALFTGDTLRFDGKKLSGSPEQFTVDTTKARESIGRISNLDFDIMLPGHGEPLRSNASDAVKKYYESLKQ